MINRIASTEGDLATLSSCTWVNLLPAFVLDFVFDFAFVSASASASASAFGFAAVLCCAVLCCDVLCCAVLCCAVKADQAWAGLKSPF